MTDMQAIWVRRSRRCYVAPPSPPQLRELHTITAGAAKESGLTLRVMEDSGDLFGGFTKSYGLFSGVNSFFVIAGDVNDPDMLEKCGYYGQKLMLEATKMGLGTCWVGGTFNKETLEKTLPNAKKLVAVITVGGVSEKRGFKERLVYGLARNNTKPLEEMYMTTQTPPEWFIDGVKAAAKAPSARNKQPVKFSWGEDRAAAYTKDNALVDLGIAKLHFELAAKGKFELGSGGAFIAD